MSSTPVLKRTFAAALTAGTLVGVFALTRFGGVSPTPAAIAQEAKAAPGDWTMFGGTPSRNFVNPHAKGIPAEWDAGKGTNVLWTVDLGSKAYGGPIVASGRVFIGTNNQKPRDPKDVDAKGEPIDKGVLMCFDEKTGAFQWQQTFPKLAAGRVVDWPKEGICSSPTVEGDKLYYVSNRCEVVCADVKTGNAHWKLDMMKELGVFPHNLAVCSPLLIGDDLFVVTANGVDEGHINVPAPKAPSFIRVQKKDGKVLWTDNSPTIKLTTAPKDGGEKEFFKRLVNRGQLIQHGQWSNPAYGVVDGQPQVIFPGGEGVVYSFDPTTNKLLWTFDCNPKDSEYELSGRGTRSDFIATPVVFKNRVYIGVGQDPEHNVGVGHFWCIDMTKRGDVSPDLVTDYSVWPPKTKPNPNSAAVWHYGGATSKEDRAKLGRNYYFGRTMSTAAIHDGLCYIAELGGFVHCLDAETGKLNWSHDTGAESWSSTYYVDGKVFFSNDDGIVTVFKHGKEKEILAENDMGSKVRATPVVANNVLYVMTENKLYAIAEKK
jgi:outer membrane protein assembly factor BamB